MDNLTNLLSRFDLTPKQNKMPARLKELELESAAHSASGIAQPIIDTSKKLENPLITRETHKSEYVIFNPAVNSSGDVYHIAAYLILCRHFGWTMPKVQLGADATTTLEQAKRSGAFLSFLGFEHLTSILSFMEHKAKYRPILRKNAIQKAVTDTGATAVDQKMTTALIASAYRRFSKEKIDKILQNGFLSYPWGRVDQQSAKLINNWVSQCVKNIIQSIGTSQFVMLHRRHSAGANNHQSLNLSEINKIKAILPVNVKLILVNCGLNPLSNLLSRDIPQIDAFGCEGLKPVFSKFAHLQLVNAIGKIPGFLGAIGNTSGTFDALAFIGINCLDLHAFAGKKSSGRNIALPAQDYRMLLQTEFMNVANIKEFSNNLKSWLNKKSVNFPFHAFELMFKRPNKHNERTPFIFAETHKKVIVFNRDYLKQNNRLDDIRTFASNFAKLSFGSSEIKLEKQTKQMSKDAEDRFTRQSNQLIRN